MALIQGLFVKQNTGSDLHVNVAEGLVTFPDLSTSPQNNMVYIPASTATLAITAASSGFVKVSIVQVSNTGVLSILDGTPVAVGQTPAYPSPATGNMALALLFTPESPITSATTAVTNANINNNVLSAEFGSRL